MEPQILRPIKKTIELIGKVSYDEHNGAWSIIRLRKQLINDFSDLKEKRSSFSYKALYYQSYLELEKAVREMKRRDHPLPILLFLVKEPGEYSS